MAARVVQFATPPNNGSAQPGSYVNQGYGPQPSYPQQFPYVQQPVQYVQAPQPQFVAAPSWTKYSVMEANGHEDVEFFYNQGGLDVSPDPANGMPTPYDTWKRYHIMGPLRDLSPQQVTQLQQNPLSADKIKSECITENNRFKRAGEKTEDYFSNDINYWNSAICLCQSNWYSNKREHERKEIQQQFLKVWIGVSILVIALIALVEGVRHDWTDHASFEVALGVIIFMFVLVLGYMFTRSSSKRQKNKLEMHNYRQQQNATGSSVQMPMLDMIALQPQLQNGFEEKQGLLLNSV